MTDLSTNDVQGRTLTAFFDSREAAQKAVDDLVAAGIPREHVRLTEGASTTGSTSTTTHNSKGFWDELKDMFMPDEDRYGYAEGLRRGGYLLSVRSDEANYTRITDLLDRDGAVDMDERESSWRASGWTGYQAGTTQGDQVSRAPSTDLGGSMNTAAAGTATAAAGTSTARASLSSTSADTLRDGSEEMIPVYEETASVAKRDVNHGRVRLRSYVVETPFSQQVNLRNEQVQVERRPVDRPVGATDAAFQDRVIEAEEHTEEALVSKQARVKEEISLRKTVENQAQTVTDTLRRTEVDVEDTRGGHALADTASAAGATSDMAADRITEHMPVIASDGTQVGTVDHLDGPDKIKLAKNTAPDGQHHYVPLAWVDHVDTHVHLNKTDAQVRAGW